MNVTTNYPRIPRLLAAASWIVCSILNFAVARAQWQVNDYQREKLGRGVIALRAADGTVSVSWRLLATDEPRTPFDVYRKSGTAQPKKLNAQPIVDSTFFVDASPSPADEPQLYFVAKTSEAWMDAEKSGFTLTSRARDYLSIPISPPEGYHANDTAPGDVDGDGEYELIVHMVGRGRDNSRGGVSTEPILHAYKLDGTLLWTIHLGKNIREGAHYTQFLVYDFDGDGKSELVCKTADGTVDGQGKVIGDSQADHRIQEGSRAGIVLSGLSS